MKAASPPRSAEFTPDSILSNLRKRGMRVTRTRRAIVEALFRASTPLSLTELQNHAAGVAKIRPDFATVFRMIVQLESLGLVQKVNLQKPGSFYELRNPTRHYDHLVCTSCGNVVILDMPCPVAEMEQSLRERYGFHSITHSLEFFGVCARCAAPEQTVGETASRKCC